MAEFAYQGIEAWNTAVKLAAAVGRLRIGSNLKAAADAQQRAFDQAGLACAIIAEGSLREGPGQAGSLRAAREALAGCRSWLHVLAAVTNEPDTLFGNELDLAEQASRQLGGMLRTLDRGPGGPPGQAGGRPGFVPRPGAGGPRRDGPPPRERAPR